MNRAGVVIGAGYGDEGKGLMTDYLSARVKNPLVVRFNGGAQAGHTVTTPNGQRRVFHHIGSGAFNLAPTFLSQHFLSNPILFEREFLDFPALVYVDPRSIVSTPWDMMINQYLELQRGVGRHGSVGCGINETHEREESVVPEMSLTVGTLLYNMHDKFCDLWHGYYKRRINDVLTGEWRERALRNGAHKERFAEFEAACRFFMKTTRVGSPAMLSDYDTVFEGAQGLMLDQNYPTFPHVTRSNTGLKNVMEILAENGQQWLATVHYVSRAYTTRHGAGPLAHEMSLDYPIVDRTNIPNGYQGELRFAPLDLSLLKATIMADYKPMTELDKNITLQMRNAVTCMDQIDHPSVKEILYYEEGQLQKATHHQFLKKLYDLFHYCSYGPSRDRVALIREVISAI